MKKLKIAVTGNIGSGKSALCELLQKKGHPVLSADNIAKELLSSDQNIRTQIIEAFGPESYTDEGPDIKYLAENVFSDPANVKRINSIVHPPTIEKIKREMESELQCNNFIFVESALIYEANMEEIFDYVLVISAEEETRITRIKQRDDVEEEEIRRRMANQMSDKFKSDNADFVIENNTSLEELTTRVDFILTLLSSISA